VVPLTFFFRVSLELHHHVVYPSMVTRRCWCGSRCFWWCCFWTGGSVRECCDTALTQIWQTHWPTGTRRDISMSSGLDIAMGLARERLNLDAAGFYPNVVATIQSARAISRRTLYAAKFVFEGWCDQLFPINALCMRCYASCRRCLTRAGHFPPLRFI